MKRSPLQRKTPLGPGASSLERGSTLSQTRLFISDRAVRYKPRACKGCGEDYQPTSGNQLYCTKACYYERALVERICAQCGEGFKRHQRGPTTRYCSWRCRDIARYGPELKLTCKGCGSTFVKRRENHLWCSQKCAIAARHKVRNPSGSLTPNDWSLKLKGEHVCRNCGQRADHLHHIVPRSKSTLGRVDWRRNGLPLCRACHRGWHNRTVTLYRGCLSEEEAAFASALGGPLWIDRNYPLPPDVQLVEMAAAAGYAGLHAGWQDRNRDRISEFREDQDA